MNKQCINKISELNDEDIKFALVTLTKATGSSPARVGQNIIVDEYDNITGTCGGGLVESKIIQLAKEALIKGQNQNFSYNLVDIGMSCGGLVEGFIQVPANDRNLIVFGGGHIGSKIYELTRSLDFDLTIVDDRLEFANKEKFPGVKVVNCNFEELTKYVEVDNNDYVVVVTRGHKTDFEVLKEVIEKDPKYIGVIGSKKKIKELFESMENEGIAKEKINKIYGPIGLKIARQDPGEIAVAILAEILLIKNKGKLEHMKAER